MRGLAGEEPPGRLPGELEVPAWASLEDLERLVRDKLPRAVFDSIAGGAGD
jgi:hypothetical protein